MEKPEAEAIDPTKATANKKLPTSFPGLPNNSFISLQS